MEAFIDNFGKFLGLMLMIGGVYAGVQHKIDKNQEVIFKTLQDNQKLNNDNQSKALKEQMETNHQLEKLNMTMSHQLEVMKNSIDNNFIIIDDNFAIINDEFVQMKKVVFDKDVVNDLPIREIAK